MSGSTTQQNDLNNNQNKTNKCFKVWKIPGKGYGCVATEDLEPGQLVLHDTEILHLSHDYKFKEWYLRGERLDESCSAILFRQIFVIVSILLATYFLPYIEYLKTSKELHLMKTSKGNGFCYYRTNQLIFCTNSFALEDGVSALFLHASRFNHSCRPNCSFVGDKQNGVFTISIRVTWRVRRGEELTISYLDSLDEGGPCTTQDRHRYLKWGYRFACNCTDCTMPKIERYRTDAKKQKLQQLMDEWRTSNNLQLDWKNIKEQLILLVQLYGCGKPEYIVSTLDIAWNTYQKVDGEDDIELEKVLAYIALHWCNIIYSSEHTNFKLWTERLQNLNNDQEFMS